MDEEQKQIGGPVNERVMLELLVKSKALPGYIRNYETAFAFAQFGKELGLPAMQAFHYLVMINGKITLSVAGMNALLLKNGITIEKVHDAEYLYKDGTMSYGNYHATEKGAPVDRITECRLTRKFPDGTTVTETTRYTFQEAKEAELVDKDNWKKFRRK